MTSATTHAATAVEGAPRPALSVFDAVMIITGIVIGGGIFSMPPLVAGITGSVQWMLVAWLAGGVLSLIGALVYAELATTYPSAGGDYHFLTRAYGRDLSFFFAWARVTVITTGSIAMLGFIFGDYMSRVLSLGAHSSTIYAVLTVVVLTAVNIVGLRESARTQNVLTVLLIAGLALVAVAGATAYLGGSAPTPAEGPPAGGLPGAFGLAMVFVLLTFGGWNEAAYISAEVKGGNRAIVKALVGALLLITAIYLLVVVAMLYGLGFDGLAKSKAVGADVMAAGFGRVGGTLIGIVVALTTLTSINATMLVGARTNYSLGRDWPIVSFMSRWDGRRDAPVRAFLVQAAIALALIGLGTIEKAGVQTMVEFTAPVFWFFFLLTGIALFVLRFRDPTRARPFRVPGYPILPLVFVCTCVYLLYSSLTYAHSRNALHWGAYLMIGGLIAWLIARFARRG
jgi:APA family basic amino acid/polyamine antiporter